MRELGMCMDDKKNFSSALLKVELRYAALQMAGERFISEAELVLLTYEGCDPYGKLRAETETNRR